MILTDLWLSNFRYHRKLHVKLQPGITGITGENGSGKSCLIEAIQFLLTGELFNGTKEEAIKIGYDTGYVVAAFILNGKKGRIERHLDVSKTILKYDGVEYKKAGEVKELWDSLLQLNPEIIKKVIIAQQGQIPLLFSGDETIREKIFQKIFLVPPTEKLRSLLWKDYIKQAPPSFPEEEVHDLRLTLGLAQRNAAMLHERIAALRLLTDEERQAVRDRLTHLTRCIDEGGKKAILEQSLVDYRFEKKNKEDKLIALEEKLSIIKPEQIEQLKVMKNTLLQQKGLFEQKQTVEAELKTIQLPYTEDEYKNILIVIDSAEDSIQFQKNKLLIADHDVVAVETRLRNLKEVKDLARCPTCNQLLRDCHDTILEEEATLKYLAEHIAAAEELLEEHKKDLFEHNQHKEEFDAVNGRRIKLQDRLDSFKNVTFDAAQLEKITRVIVTYEALQAEYTEAQLDNAAAERKLAALANEIDQLAVYEGEDIEADREACLAELEANTEDQRIYRQLAVDVRVKEAECKTLEERIKNSEENHEKNKKRNAYVLTLNKVYDLLHSSQFPRKLIQSYADIVTEYVQDYLQLFSMPYTARVADDFRIELLDSDDRVLPKVSGGQEIQVGISLHLALHDLFSQSFPLMIIDEGTTHLDTKNRKAYFDIIRSLKDKNKLKQILIVDHDPQLAEVVDQYIELEKINE